MKPCGTRQSWEEQGRGEAGRFLIRTTGHVPMTKTNTSADSKPAPIAGPDLARSSPEGARKRRTKPAILRWVYFAYPHEHDVFQETC